MEKKEEESAAKLWKQKVNEASPLAGRHNYMIGISDFKFALKAEIEKEIKNPESYYPAYTKGLEKTLSLIDEVKPLEK